MKPLLPVLFGLALLLPATGRADDPAPLPQRQSAKDASGAAQPGATAAPTAEATIEELIAGLKHKEVSKRRLAALTLGHRGPRAAAAVPALVAALKEDKEPAVRAQAAEALGGIRILAKAALPDLLNALKDADASVRETAAEALADIGSDAAKVIPALLPLLSDADMNVRCAAARSIGDFGTAARTAVPALQNAQKNDKHPFVREAAADALKDIDRATRKLDS
jgi:HEAT repeat protein